MVKTAGETVALVTGGGRGIGRAVVEALLGEGWTVFFCGRSEASLAPARAELERAFPGRLGCRAADVRSAQEVEELVRWVAEETGRLDCLINNAGVGVFAAIDELSVEDWRRVLDTNLSGAFYAIRSAAPMMKRQGSGWIFNIASLAGRNVFAGGAAYNASKFGLVALSEAAMLDLRHHGVRVTAILPGSVDTGFRTGDGRSGGDGWMLRPEDVARCVLDCLRFPNRALPSLIELRPSRPPRK